MHFILGAPTTYPSLSLRTPVKEMHLAVDTMLIAVENNNADEAGSRGVSREADIYEGEPYLSVEHPCCVSDAHVKQHLQVDCERTVACNDSARPLSNSKCFICI